MTTRLRQRLDRALAGHRSTAVEVWYRDDDGTWSSRADPPERLTDDELVARPCDGTRILVERVDMPPASRRRP
jgi:hypothetical protein